ncbi:MAG: FIMAH domain-containing protein [Planctomycetota bacterium]|jgi:hypothetical protein
MKSMSLLLTFVLGLVIVTTTIVEADVTVTAVDKGRYEEGGFHFDAGFEFAGFDFNHLPEIDERRTFYLFDLPNVGEEVTSAVLRLDGALLTENISETLNVWDVTSTIADLTSPHLRLPHPERDPRPDIFDDLGSGVQYSSLEIDRTLTRPIYEFQLNQAAIQKINDSLGSSFALGMSLDLTNINPYIIVDDNGVETETGLQGLELSDLDFPNTNTHELVLTTATAVTPTVVPATDPSGDAPSGLDIVAVDAITDGTNLTFNITFSDNPDFNILEEMFIFIDADQNPDTRGGLRNSLTCIKGGEVQVWVNVTGFEVIDNLTSVFNDNYVIDGQSIVVTFPVALIINAGGDDGIVDFQVLTQDSSFSNYDVVLDFEIKEGCPLLTSRTLTQSITHIITDVIDLNLQSGIENNLDSKLDTAMQAIDDVNENNDGAAINSLNAFINAVEAQRGNKITDAEADALIAEAQAIITFLGG